MDESRTAKHGSDHASSTGTNSGWRGRLRALKSSGREWVREHQWWVALGALTLLSTVGVWMYVLVNRPAELRYSAYDFYRKAVEAFEIEDFVEARRLASRAYEANELEPEHRAELALILGLAAAQRAEKLEERQRTYEFMLAAAYLKEALSRGLAEEWEGAALSALGTSLYYVGRTAQARPILEEAIDKFPEKQAELQLLLVACLLDDSTPQFETALRLTEQVIAEPELASEKRQQALLQRAAIQFRMKKYADCEATLAKLAADERGDANAELLRIQMQMQTAADLKANDPSDAAILYRKAMKRLKDLEWHSGLSVDGLAATRYLIGVCELGLDQPAEALALFERTHMLHPHSAAGWMSDLETAELLRASGQDDAASLAYERVLFDVVPRDRFRNPWITYDELHRRLVGAFDSWMKARKYSAAAKLASQLYRVAPRDEALDHLAEARVAWARSLFDEAKRLEPAEAEAKTREGRLQLRLAGRAYQQLAAARIDTDRYALELHNSGNCFLEGQSFPAAIQLFEQYVAAEAGPRVSLGLYGLAWAHASLGSYGRAIAYCRECFESYPRTPAAYQARVLAARAYTERGETDDAVRVLEETLNIEGLTPASIEWRQGLFMLGRLRLDRGEAKEAIARLHEAVERYPDSDESFEARQQLAAAHRSAAESLVTRRQEEPIESTRASLTRDINKHLAAALEQYEQLEKSLEQRESRRELNVFFEHMLRNARFSRAGLLFDMARFNEAIEAYTAVADRYAQAPEALSAYLQVAACYRRMDRAEDARGTLKQARLLLRLIPADADFTATTNHTREDWQKLLETLETL